MSPSARRKGDGDVPFRILSTATLRLWRVRWGERWLYVYLLLEFQSTVDRLMAVRLLTYVGLLYQDLAAAGKTPMMGLLRVEVTPDVW